MSGLSRKASSITAAAVLALFGAGATTVLAQGAGGFAGRPRGGQAMRSALAGLRGLGLSDAQRQQIRSITESHRSDFRTLAARLRTAQDGLRETTTAETMDEAAIRNAAAQLADVQADAAVLRARVRQEVWNVLTPEQQQKATAARTLREQRRQQRRERIEERLKQRRANPA
ncbi:MAG: Spy/CpxP family protein refolding chaperone [Vicinamibacterales bacterium]